MPQKEARSRSVLWLNYAPPDMREPPNLIGWRFLGAHQSRGLRSLCAPASAGERAPGVGASPDGEGSVACVADA